MIPSHFAGPRPRFLLTLLASAAIATTGCSNSPVTSGGGAASAQLKIGGKIHGGNQPVSGATVNLYFAGQQGFATGAQLVASTTSSTDGNGSFNFTQVSGAPNNGSTATFVCPVSGPNFNPYVFVVARGGTTTSTVGASPNTDAAFIAPMARCNDLLPSTSVYMSEVLTVATMAAIHQYMDPTNATTTPIESTIGADGIFVSTQALVNSFNGVANLASLGTGLGNVSTQRIGVGVTMTVTPELAKINQLANIISSCINQTTSNSTNCQAIYAAAAPPASAATTSVPGATEHVPTDLLTALYNIFTNPTNGGSTNLNALYNLSAASGAPYQPTLTAPPTDWSIGVAFTPSGTCTVSGAAFINNPTEIMTDISGSLFVTNSAAAGSQVEFSSIGIPLGCQGTPNASGLVYDSVGNTWTGSGSTNTITRYAANLTTALAFTTAAPVRSVTANGYGDVFFSATDGNLYEIHNGAQASGVSTPVQINTLPLGTGSRILMDTANSIWAASGAAFITQTSGIPVPNGPLATLNFGSSATSQVAVTGPSSSVAPTSNLRSGVYTSSASSTAIQALGGTVTPFTVTSGGGMNNPAVIALDGAQNVWTGNAVGSSLSAFDATGAALTPATGYIKPVNFLGPQSAIFIDPSGNIWVGLAGSNTITEVVGAAVPVYQPYSNGLDPTTPRYGKIP